MDKIFISFCFVAKDGIDKIIIMIKKIIFIGICVKIKGKENANPAPTGGQIVREHHCGEWLVKIEKQFYKKKLN